MSTDLLSNIDFINAFLLPNIDTIRHQYRPIEKEVGIGFGSLTLGRFKNGKKLSPLETQRLASFTGFYSLEQDGPLKNGSLKVCEEGLAIGEARLGIQLRLLQNKAVKFGRRINNRVYLPSDVSLYVYVDPDGAWFCNVEESDFIEQRDGLTNEMLRHIKYCARKMQNKGCDGRVSNQKFSLRFSKR